MYGETRNMRIVKRKKTRDRGGEYGGEKRNLMR